MKRLTYILFLFILSMGCSLNVLAGNDNIEIYENNKYTSTNIITNDNDHQIVTEVFDKCIGNTVIVALYQDGRTEYVKSYLADEDLTSITTTPDFAFDKVKVFVWENFQTLKPVCSIYNTSISCERHAYTNETTPKGCSSNAIITYTCSVCGHTYDSLVPDINITVAQTSKQSIVTNGYAGYVREFKINVSGGYGTVLCKYEIFSNSTATTPAQTIDYTSEHGLSLQYTGVYSSINRYVLQITAKDDYGNISKYRFVLGESSVIPYYISELEHNITQIEHTVGTWKVTSEPTCTEEGIKTTNCLGCNEIMTENIPANGHNYREEDDICDDCGELISYTDGLSYTLINNDSEYEVSGIGEATEEDIVIPRTYNGKPITQIGEEAFENCKTIKSVRIPSGVKYIREWAFYYSSIKEIVIPSSVEVVESYAFSGCNNVIKKIEGVSYVGNWTVDCDESVYNVTLKDGTVGIGGNAFYNCSNLVNIDIPDSVVTIGEYAFYKCTSLTSVTIPHNIKSVGNYAFSNCSNLSELNISGNITDIGSSVAYNCKKLEHITILDGSTQISKYLLKGFANAKTVTIPDSVTTICEYAFADNDSLTTITIPNGVRVIEKNAFYGCDNLNDIIILDGITSIGERVFYNCTGLKNIIIPDSVVTIGEYAFYKCTSLTSVTIPNTVSSIGNYAFYNCTSLTDISIPGNITSVGRSTFYNCSNIKRISIADKSTEIAGWDFSKFTALTNITIPDSITKIDSSVSFNCAFLTAINFEGTKSEWDKISKGNNQSLDKIKVCYSKSPFDCCLTYTVTNNQITITGCNTDCVGDVVIPSIFNGCRVTTIGENAFYFCSNLTNVSLPDSVTSIGVGAFGYCRNLKKITMSDSIKSISAGAFCGCRSLEGIIIPKGVTIIENSTFDDCDGLTNITVPNGVTSIDGHAFFSCSYLTNIVIPDSVVSIGDNAFEYCRKLTQIIFAGTVEQWESISKGAMWDSETGDYVVYCVDGNIYK